MRSPIEIMMLGVGNGFVKTTYQNNALLRTDGKLYLIDCGTTAWHSLHEIGLGFEDIEAIFITHLHYDHCGGLDEAALYGAYAAKRKMKLILPAPLRSVLWDNCLSGTLENVAEGKRSLQDYFEVQGVEEGVRFAFGADRGTSNGSSAADPSGLNAFWMQTPHVPSKFSCSLVIGERFFYSADMQANPELMGLLHDQGIETFYHDACFAGNPVHADVLQLCQYPAEIRERIYLMHYGEKPAAIEEKDLGGMKLLRQHEWRKWD
ncbi:MBL fold metallo-hydrolase [Paenibacillus filicis]|uniref:MBL fold metallo-hydrolase n=1 Tax=Paenibacillus filicis TaxID=669464 RepID=A0ABU9DF33_9BACL